MLELSDIPGPRAVPLLGATGNSALFALDPLGHTGRLFGRYGDIVSLARGRPARLVSPSRDVPGVLFVRGAALNRELLSDHEHFHKSPIAGRLFPVERVTRRTRPLTRLLTGLFSVNGDEHRAQRRLLMPAFHKSSIESYRDDMVATTESVLAEYGMGQTRDIKRDMMELTLRVATKTLFGADLGEAGVQIGRDLQRWLELLRPSAVLPIDVPGLAYHRWLNLSHQLDRAMADLVARKRENPGSGTDILSTLIASTYEDGGRLSEDELIGHVGVLFGAGHETSSNALCWTLFLLSQHPHVLADLKDELIGQLRGEAPRAEQLPHLALLDRVVKESMRLFPPAPLNHRVAALPCELGGFALPAKTEILSSIYHTHRMPELYSEPERFLPQRWERLAPGPYAYGPFSGGPRMCIGATFAITEIKVVLAVMLQRYHFELVPGSRVDRYVGVTMAPKGPLRMHLTDPQRPPRHSATAVAGNVRQMVALGVRCSSPGV